ncbi:hypothetical protein J7T55_013318 [Diaporthe amygdali]|uniref:uncharacterized protein n=1 Tax=Phomopsis amygdali TaxID=1214568 RepID=UPI0022FE8CFF|nr:uncharacterized protein J7T55_013318 [Diaporthe amygdali]KAJ0119083.1 hypothetical protein J7T55_013318 [Diaporthe amygdali]
MSSFTEIGPFGQQHHYLLLAAVAVGVAVFSFAYKVLRNPLAKLPGPWYSKITSAVLTNEFLQGRRAKYVQLLHEKYGPIVRIGPNEVDVMDVAAAKQIHTVKATYLKGPFYKAVSAPGQHNVFNTADIYFHRRHRKLLQAPFSDASLQSFQPNIESRVRLAIQRMIEESASRGVVDVFKWWLFMATDVIGELSFGESFRTLEQGKKSEYTVNLEKVAAVGAKRATFPTLAKLAMQGFPIPGFGENTNLLRSMRRYAQESLDRYKKIVEEDPEKPVPTLFTRLFKGEEDETLTFKEIIDEAQAYIIAGTDTTAITLTYAVWRVCQNPKIRDRLVEELQQLPEDFKDHDAMKLPYLNQVIEESLRLHSAAPSGLPRIVPPEGANMAGQYLPGGSIVCTQAWSMHRIEEIFPDPEKFDPDRWASPTKDMKDGFMPFGGGSRICLGLHLARMELRLGTAHFFRTFPNAKVSTLEGMSDDDMEQVTYFLAPPKNKRCLIECS